ncbi:hypothetical protein KCP78_23115 [Salmonella enterica subsp. enterica]|nr:hypothetical protein KCP78_23115 [Salmonella enterica subsp. enterica]
MRQYPIHTVKTDLQRLTITEGAISLRYCGISRGEPKVLSRRLCPRQMLQTTGRQILKIRFTHQSWNGLLHSRSLLH